MTRKLPETLDMIRGLVGIPSVSSTDPHIDQSNRPVIDRLANWAEGAGMTVDVQPVGGSEGKYNLVAVLGGGAAEGAASGLVLSGHTDTVPFDEGRWDHDPFAATEDDGRIYGLGTADMKSFLGLALEAASAFDPKVLREPVTIVGTADEECTMSGAKDLARRGRRLGRRAVIGEPTSLRPIRMHKGMRVEAVRLNGRSGHSSNPALGVSALDGMQRVLTELVTFRDRLAREYHNPAFEVPVPTINLGRIVGGDAANRICASCELEFDLRALPGMDVPHLVAGLHARIREVLDGSGLDVDLDVVFPGAPPFLTPADAELVRLAEELTGEAAGSVGFGTEGPFLSELGMETIIMGPGSIDVAHQPNEFLPVASIRPTIDLLREMIERTCVRPTSTAG